MTEDKRHRRYRPVTPTESLIGVVVLIVLAIVAVLVFMEQYDYDPGLYRLNPSLLLPEQPDKGRPVPVLLSELGKVMSLSAGQVESFTPDTVYEKIDGKDQAFIDLGMKTLDVIRLNRPDQPGENFEVYVYDMSEPENAFGIFAAQRTDDPEWIYGDLVGQAAPNGIFFYKGPYYVCLVGSSTAPAFLEVMDRAAKTLADRLDGQAEIFWAKQVFPQANQVANSQGYVLGRWLGTEFFDCVFTVRYALNGREVTAYLSRRADADNAVEILGRLRTFLKGNEATFISLPPPDDTLIVAEWFGSYEIIFTHGRIVGGVSQAENQDSALGLARVLRQAVIDFEP